MKIKRRFEYPQLDRQTNEETGVRHYVTPDGPVASVTTILSATSDKSFLVEWEKRVGKAEAERIRREASDLGTIMHTHLENYIQGEPRPDGTNLIYKMAERMADVIIECGLSKVEEIWGIEEMLYYPNLFAGTTDLVGVYQGEPAIMDFKSSKKLKSESQITDYFLQGSAYCLAHNELFGTNIQSIVIFMADRNFKYREFVVKPHQFSKYRDQWIERLGTFYG